MKPTFDLDVSLEGSDIIIAHGRDFRAGLLQACWFAAAYPS
jgi:hypothetical protein